MYESIYRQARERVTEIARGLGDDELGRTVPACPEWTVREMLAHVVGVAADVVNQRMDGAPGPEWTVRQVEERRDRSVAEDLAEWAGYAERAEATLAANPRIPLLAHDLVQHEGDLLGALGRGRPPREAWSPLLDNTLAGLARRPELPGALVLATTDGRRVVGAGDPVAELEVDGYELYRAVFGRRSRAQMAAWAWSGDPAAFLDLIPVFPPREDDLVEV
ncbi:maleylpyruvate isomerase family mycothiol-dependent enzyme [Streptoalloteichus tenebrarius]|uniref:maleylpyruvate isomerase family mycothiol-dependent enzyme n=1 Tax=Streptoalloteichus tenebrarius (strain ATCC 17920 / DSM 40477 / JCM 4838 / CBS 697.72 / NBRC 16177 / NCIMB 11028 / NRRL B-12390 / A12253. 1 / ISP 5477) TaxID=1933 RepID=UPI0020A5E9D2|nr:maleylpyruvate isomerase family mycothiol-dependent enzyme [Streptoalloteichus tenebrarius]